MFLQQGFQAKQVYTISAISASMLCCILLIFLYSLQQHGPVSSKDSLGLAMGVTAGFYLTAVFLSLLLALITRIPLLLVLTAFFTNAGILLISLDESLFNYLSLNTLSIRADAVLLYVSLSVSSVLLLTNQLMTLSSRNPLIQSFLKSCVWVYIAIAAFTFILPYQLVFGILMLLLMSTSLMILIAGFKHTRAGNSISVMGSAVWVVILVSAIGATCHNYGIIIPQIFIPQILPSALLAAALTISVLLISMLTIVFNTYLTQAASDKNQAKENERRAIKAKDELLKLQEDAKRDLEYRVEERTLELEVAMRELSEVNRELERLTAIDSLTGLLNRRYFDKRLLAEARRSRREQRCMSVAMLDIDFFKKINDTYGHQAGDACLKAFANTLKEQIRRPSDIICRYGGEEFVVILPGTELDGVQGLMQRVREAVAGLNVEYEGDSIQMTVSIGATSGIVSHDDQHEMMIAAADKLLYQAKQSGRNQVLAQSF